MTELLHKDTLNREFSRKTFLKGGGAMIVGFSVVGAGLAGKAQAVESPYASNGPFDQNQIDAWIVIHEDNTASVKAGTMFRGTGSETGILQIAAEELDLDMSQVRIVEDDSNVTPNTGSKGASNTVTKAGTATRAAAASARQALLDLASKQLGVPVAQLSVSSGVVSGGGKSVTYGALLGGKLFNVTMPASYNMQNVTTRDPSGLQPGVWPAKPPNSYKLVGTSPPRVEIPDIVSGKFTFLQNIKVPGMLHGRIVRPRGQAVFGFGAPVLSVDESSIKKIPGARVVRKNNFIGVVAPAEFAAIQAAAQLKVKWAEPPKALGGHGNEFKRMRELDSAGKTVHSPLAWFQQNSNTGNVGGALASATHVVTQTYAWPSHVHNPMGASVAVADVTQHGARVFASTQGVYSTRNNIAAVLGLPVNKVHVSAPPIGGIFGPSAAEDANLAAALMSQLAGAPVRVQFMRWDEIGWGNTGPGMLMDVRAGVDPNGNMVGFDFTHFYPQYKGGPEMTAQLAGMPLPASASSIGGNQFPTRMYRVAGTNNRYLVKSIPLKDNWVQAAWLRAGAAPGVMFAGEQVVDELAHRARMDPVAFRLQNVTQDEEEKRSLLAVMDAVTRAANWQPRVAASQLSDANVVSGRGVAWCNAYRSSQNGNFGWTSTAAIADVEVNKKTGKITPKHIYVAAAAGLAVNPGLIESQIVGGIVQVASRALVEQFRYDRKSVTSSDFVTYPLLRFNDAPKVTPIVVQQLDMRTKGVGEPVSVLAGAAIANAFFDATGVRMTTAPMTPARVRATLATKGAGVAGVK